VTFLREWNEVLRPARILLRVFPARDPDFPGSCGAASDSCGNGETIVDRKGNEPKRCRERSVDPIKANGRIAYGPVGWLPTRVTALENLYTVRFSENTYPLAEGFPNPFELSEPLLTGALDVLSQMRISRHLTPELSRPGALR